MNSSDTSVGLLGLLEGRDGRIDRRCIAGLAESSGRDEVHSSVQMCPQMQGSAVRRLLGVKVDAAPVRCKNDSADPIAWLIEQRIREYRMHPIGCQQS